MKLKVSVYSVCRHQNSPLYERVSLIQIQIKNYLSLTLLTQYFKVQGKIDLKFRER